MVNHNNYLFIDFFLKNGFNIPHSLTVSNDKFVTSKMKKYAPKLIFTIFCMVFKFDPYLIMIVKVLLSSPPTWN